MMSEQEKKVVVVWTTFPGDGDPAAFAQTLVSECLAACVTTQGGLRSVYRWREGVEEATEYQVTIKTTVGRVGELERRVGELHPYDVPEFLVLPVSGGSTPYLAWLRASMRLESGSE
jgi:periplasmic divalent cation tolerance protein